MFTLWSNYTIKNQKATGSAPTVLLSKVQCCISKLSSAKGNSSRLPNMRKENTTWPWTRAEMVMLCQMSASKHSEVRSGLPFTTTRKISYLPQQNKS